MSGLQVLQLIIKYPAKICWKCKIQNQFIIIIIIIIIVIIIIIIIIIIIFIDNFS